MEAVLIKLSVFLDGEQITGAAIDGLAPESIPFSSAGGLLAREPGVAINLQERLREIEGYFVEQAFSETGSQKKATELLSISQQQVSKVLKTVKGAGG